MDAAASYDDKARHLRRLYRQRGERGSAAVQAEYNRLFPEADVRLDQILVSAWKEGRELAGWTYDNTAQGWRRADGSAVREDDGREWSHL